MFDYAVMDRPIVIYAYDWDTYVRTRGVNFDLMAEPPGVVATTQEALLEAFRSGEVFGEEAAKVRADFRRRFCEYDDGRASERVVRRIFLGERLAPEFESNSTAVGTVADRDAGESGPEHVEPATMETDQT
jgi:CDP-glycerol glycerophosphotransferase